MKKGPGAALQAAEALGKKKKKSGAWHAHLCLGMGVGGNDMHMRPEGCSLLIAVDLYSCQLLFQALFISP